MIIPVPVTLVSPEEGRITPNVFIYNSLIGKAPSYSQARGLLQEMERRKIRPRKGDIQLIERIARQKR